MISLGKGGWKAGLKGQGEGRKGDGRRGKERWSGGLRRCGMKRKGKMEGWDEEEGKEGRMEGRVEKGWDEEEGKEGRIE